MAIAGLIVMLAGGVAEGQTAASAPTAPSSQPATRGQRAYVACAEPVLADSSTESRQAARKLMEVAPNAEFAATRLVDVVRWVQKTQKLNLVPNWRDLQTAGAGPDAAVTLRVTNVSYAEVLRLALEQVAPGKLDLEIADGVAEIGTRAWLGTRSQARSYDVEKWAEKGWEGMSGGGAEARTARAERLAKLIATLTGPWPAKTDGVKYLARQLVVAGPPRAQWEASTLWDDLRKPIRVPPTAAEAAAEKKATGEPVKLPARLYETRGHFDARQALAANGRIRRENGDAPTGAQREVQDAPLGTVLPMVSMHGSLNVVPLWASLKAVDMTPQKKVLLQVQGTLGEDLAEMLRLAGASQPIGYVVDAEGVVIVAARKDLPVQETTAVFDLRDLARRRAFAAAGARPAPTETLKILLEELELARKDGGWAARVVEYEGLVAVRGEADAIRTVGRFLGGLAK